MFPATKKNVLRSTPTCVLMCRRLSAETPSSTTSAMWCTRRSVPPSTPVPRLTAHTSPAPWSSNTSATSNMSPFVTKARVELLFIGFYMTRLQLSFVELSEKMSVMCVCQEWRRCVRRSAPPCAEWWRTGSARRSTCSATSRPARRTSSRVSRRRRSVGMRTGPSATLTTRLSRSGPVSLFVSWSFCPSASLLNFFKGGSLLHGP